MGTADRKGPLSLEVDVIPQLIQTTRLNTEVITALAEYVLRAERAAGMWNIAVVLTNDDMLRALHRDFMGIDIETDVMTFPADTRLPEPTNGGDIVISLDRAADHASDWGHSTWDEVRFLVVHGLLHLCGWDDETERDRARMLERQRELLEAFDAEKDVHSDSAE